MAKLRLSIACSNYDRTRALLEGRIPVDGIELTCLDLPIEEIFFRACGRGLSHRGDRPELRARGDLVPDRVRILLDGFDALGGSSLESGTDVRRRRLIAAAVAARWWRGDAQKAQRIPCSLLGLEYHIHPVIGGLIGATRE
jgi:hypothetical protein